MRERQNTQRTVAQASKVHCIELGFFRLLQHVEMPATTRSRRKGENVMTKVHEIAYAIVNRAQVELEDDDGMRREERSERKTERIVCHICTQQRNDLEKRKQKKI